MYICICNAVTDSDIRQAVDDGVRGIGQLKMKTGCATNCGCCEQMVREVLNKSLREQGSFLSIVATPAAA